MIVCVRSVGRPRSFMTSSIDGLRTCVKIAKSMSATAKPPAAATLRTRRGQPSWLISGG